MSGNRAEGASKRHQPFGNQSTGSPDALDEFLPPHYDPDRMEPTMNTSLNTERLSPRENSAEFYNQIVNRLAKFGGFELGGGLAQNGMNHHHALDLIDREFRLGFNSIVLESVKLLHFSLGQTKRYSGDLYIEPSRGGNPALHSDFAAALYSEVLRRAGLLDHDWQSSYHTARRGLHTLAILLHDVGEIALFEDVSLAHKAHKVRMKGDESEEWRIGQTLIKAAAHCVALKREDAFTDFVVIIRSGLSNGGELDQVLSSAEDELSKLIAECEELGVKAHPELQRSLSDLVDCYNLIEPLESAGPLAQEAAFEHAFTKAVERLDGSRYYARHCNRSASEDQPSLFSGILSTYHENSAIPVESLPFALADSYKMLTNFGYTEHFVGRAFQLAADPWEKRAAVSVAIAAYQSAIDLLNRGPEYINLAATEADHRVREGVEKLVRTPESRATVLEELERTLQIEQSSLRGRFEKGDPSVVSREQLIERYVLAINGLLAGRFTPPAPKSAGAAALSEFVGSAPELNPQLATFKEQLLTCGYGHLISQDAVRYPTIEQRLKIALDKLYPGLD